MHQKQAWPSPSTVPHGWPCGDVPDTSDATCRTACCMKSPAPPAPPLQHTRPRISEYVSPSLNGVVAPGYLWRGEGQGYQLFPPFNNLNSPSPPSPALEKSVFCGSSPFLPPSPRAQPRGTKLGLNGQISIPRFVDWPVTLI